jgi:hypothetical protein
MMASDTSPLVYIWSWSLSEAGRASIFTPLILRNYSRPGWFKMRSLQAAEGIINSNQDFVSPIEAVIYCCRIIAEFNTMVGTNKATELGAFQKHARLSRHYYLSLLRYAQAATTRPETSARRDGDMEDNTSVARMLDADDDDLGQTAPEPSGRTIKTKIEKLMTLPNVHVDTLRQTSGTMEQS